MTDPIANPIDVTELRRRQKSRTRIMGILLVALVVLIYGVTIAKMGLAQ